MQRKIKWLVLLVWMLVIFLFSAQTGEQSSESSGLVEQLLSLFPFIPHQLFGIELQLIIRKGAHFTEYLILYVLIFNVLIDTSGGALAMVLIAMINQLQIITKRLKEI